MSMIWNSHLSQPTDTQFYRRQKQPDRSLTYRHFSTSCLYENIRRNNFVVDTKFWQRVCLWLNCVVLREYRFDELCGLRKIAVSWAILCAFAWLLFPNPPPANLASFLFLISQTFMCCNLRHKFVYSLHIYWKKK